MSCSQEKFSTNSSKAAAVSVPLSTFSIVTNPLVSAIAIPSVKFLFLLRRIGSIILTLSVPVCGILMWFII